MINIYSSSRYKLNKKYIRSYAQEMLDTYRVNPSSIVNIVFVGKRKMKQIANEYKHEDVALPVLSFPYTKEQEQTENVLGEIMICYPQAVLLAAEREKNVETMMQMLIAHGMENIFMK